MAFRKCRLWQRTDQNVMGTTQDSGPEAVFTSLLFVTHLMTVNASAMEQADKTGASHLGCRSFQMHSLKSFGRPGGQDPHLSLMGKLKSQEKTGFVVWSHHEQGQCSQRGLTYSQALAWPTSSRQAKPLKSQGEMIGLYSLETWPHLQSHQLSKQGRLVVSSASLTA